MAMTRASKPGQYLVAIVILFMVLLVAAFIVRTATLRADAARGMAAAHIRSTLPTVTATAGSSLHRS